MALNPAALAFKPSPGPAGPLPVDAGQYASPLTAAGTSRNGQPTQRVTPTPPRPILCRFFRSPTGCPQAAGCRFVHEAEGSVGPLEPGKHQRLKREQLAAEEAEREREAAVRQLDKRQLISCKFWVEGFCHRGSACVYAHTLTPPTIDDVLAGKGTAKSGGPAAREAASEAAPPPDAGDEAPNDSDDDSSDGPEPCAICYERPQFYGLLECCSHAFCLACLQSWRSNTDSESRDAAKTCPLCRKRSRFITPSSRFFPDGAEKQALVDRYKRNMAKKECRYFAVSLAQHPDRAPRCPFRDLCFYSHAHPFPDGPRYTFGPLLPALPRRRRSTTGSTVADAVAAFLRSLSDDEPWLSEPDLLGRDESGRRRTGPAAARRAIEELGRQLERANDGWAGSDLFDFGDSL